MDPEPEPLLLFANVEAIQVGHIVALVALLFLLVTSALISGAEVAFFSNHKEGDVDDNARMDELLENPKKLLATILVSNNFINVGIVILSAFIIDSIFDFSENPYVGIAVQLVGITFVLLLFGEVLPKIYASRKPQRFALFVLPGVYYTYQLLLPLSRLLAKSLDFFKERSGSSASISVNDLSQALELANAEKEGDDKMLIDIVKFGHTTVKQIMTPRPDMIAIDDGADFDEVLALIRDSGYSRLPVYSESIDQISGLLYIKDLLAHTEREKDFKWKELMRPAFFVPESKKIDDLLQEFRAKKIHLAIVVDEFGGTSGLVTLEDIIEEVVGEINDEFDLETAIYNKIDDHTYIFEGKTPLHEFLRILHVENTEVFDQAKGDSDTLAGFIIEQTGDLPQINQSFDFENINFSVETIENRRIQRIKVTLPSKENI